MDEQEIEDAFDDAVEQATQAVIEEFECIGLPEGDQLSHLMIQVNDSLTQIFAEWK